MSLIAGVWNLDGRAIDQDLAHLGRQLGGVRHEVHAGWVDGPAGLVCHQPRGTGGVTGTTPPVHRSGTAVIAFDGRLDNRAELLDLLGPRPGLLPDASDASFVVAAYERFGGAFPERLLGDFALALFDPVSRQLVLARDPIGLRPLHFWRSPRVFLFASTITSLLAHPLVSRRPHDAVVARCLTGRLLDEDHWATCFDGISTLPPAHLAVVSPDRFLTRRYWSAAPRRAVRLGSRGEYVEAFRHHFNQAVERRLRGTPSVGVSLSGGLDSSAVYCAAETIRRAAPDRYPRVLGFSYIDPDDSPESETGYVRDIERKYGTSCHCLPAAASSGLLDGAMDQLRLGEAPVLSLQWPNVTALLDHAHAAGARAFLTGQSGDQVVSDEAYLVDLFRRLRWRRVWRDLQEMPRWLQHTTDLELFVRDFLRNLVVFHAPDACLEGYRWVRWRVFGASPVPAWYTTTFRRNAEAFGGHRGSGARSHPSAYAKSMQRYLTSPWLAVCNDWYAKIAEAHGLEQRAPFLDRDLLEFVLAIPGEELGSGGVLKGLLRDGLRGVLPDSIADRRWKSAATSESNDGVRQIVPHLVETLRSGALLVEFGYVDRARALEVLDRMPPIQGKEAFVGFPVWRLIGLELWLRQFFGEGVRRQPASARHSAGTATVGASVSATGWP